MGARPHTASEAVTDLCWVGEMRAAGNKKGRRGSPNQLIRFSQV